MALQIVLRGYREGEPRPGGGPAAREVLAPFITATEPELDYLRLEYGASGADVYLDADTALVNQLAGAELWPILLEAARAADWVIEIGDGPVGLTRPEQRLQLPVSLADTAAEVADEQGLAELLSS